MKIVILDRATLGFHVDVSIFEKFGEVISYDVTKENETLERVKNADIVITNKVVINKEHMDNSKMKLVCITATGTNNVDFTSRTEKKTYLIFTKRKYFIFLLMRNWWFNGDLLKINGMT